MKRLVIALSLLVVPFVGIAQDDSRFSTDGTSVIWQNVYQTQLDSAAVVDGLLSSGHFDNVVLTKDGFTCRIIPHEANYRGAGLKRGQVFMYISSADVEGRAVVQIREGRYRVTVDEVVFITNISGGGGMFTLGERTALERYALNGSGEFKSRFWNKGSSPVLDYDLFSLFDVKEQGDQDEDW